MEQEVNVQFFIDELAKMNHDNDRRYESLTNRMAELERKTHGQTDEIFDAKLMGFMIFITVAPILLQLTADLISKWRSSESSQ